MIDSQEIADSTGREGALCPVSPEATSDGIIVQCENQESGVGTAIGTCFTRNRVVSETQNPCSAPHGT